MFGSKNNHKPKIFKDTRRKKKQNLIIKLLTIVLIALMALLLIPITNAQTYPQTEQEALQSHEVKSGRLLLAAKTKNYTPALLLNSRAHFTVTGMQVNVELEQTFKNSSSDWQEGVYVFPLPENSAVSYMAIQLQDKIIEARVQEKKQARKTYQKAKALGKKAALIEQERPNLFTQSVANIAPGETLTVRLHYQQPVTYDLGEFSFRFPMTITPRYIPGSAQLDNEILVSENGTNNWGWAQDTNRVHDASRITPRMLAEENTPQDSHKMDLEIVLDAGLPLASIASAYHEITTVRESNKYRINLRHNTTPMNQDFELRWRAVEQHAPEAAVFMERIEVGQQQEDYATLMLLPPQQEKTNNILARQVTFVIDTSGSMQGQSIKQAKQSLSYALHRLKPHDQFNIIEFDSQYSSLFITPQPVTQVNIELAEQFIHYLHAGGGTEMIPALTEALTKPVSESLLSQVIFITDGAVGNESKLFDLINKEIKNSRLFTVGIGSAPNSFFMRKAAEIGHGTFTYIGRAAEVASKMSKLFLKIESPILSHIKIEWPADLNVEYWPKSLPDLYLGEPLLVHAKFDRSLARDNNTVQVSGQVAGQEWQRQLHFVFDTEQESLKGISKLWAREKISALLDEKILGRSPDKVRRDVLTVALKHQLVSPFTSLVAVEEQVTRPSDAQVTQQPVPNLVAKGQVAHTKTLVTRKSLTYPKTATAAQLHFAIALISFILLLIYTRGNKRATK